MIQPHIRCTLHKQSSELGAKQLVATYDIAIMHAAASAPPSPLSATAARLVLLRLLLPLLLAQLPRSSLRHKLGAAQDLALAHPDGSCECFALLKAASLGHSGCQLLVAFRARGVG